MPYSVTQRQKPRPARTFSKPLFLGLAAISLVLIVAALELTNTTHIFHKAPVAKTAVIPSTPSVSGKKQPTTTDTPSTAGGNDVAGSNDKGAADTTASPPSSTTTGEPPSKPSGTFISNHNPNLDGNPYPSQEQSVCNTTPGASCAITFTNGSLTRTLVAQTTNSDGSTLWNWDVKQAGFSEGTWTVTVTATLNGQTASAQDTLKVGP